MRPVTQAFLRAVRARETEEVFLLLLTLNHADLAQPIRVVDNTQDVVSGGNAFVAYPFEIDLPEDTGERPARARIRIDNVDRQLVATLRSAATPPAVTIEVVMASAPDTVEASFAGMSLVEAGYDVLTITGELTFEDVLNEPFPGVYFTPANFPGMFP